jgi:nicotinate-nucleotide adenylyltransferase
MGETTSPHRPRLGFFGGSFDPLHKGHLTIGKEALEKAKLDKLLLCPAYHAPLRNLPPLFSAKHRLGMVHSLSENYQGMEACPLEVDHAQVRYTFETILEVQSLYPEHELFLILGTDQFSRLQEWKNIEQLITLVHFLVFARGQDQRLPPCPTGMRMTNMDNSLIDLSSTQVRKKIQLGQDLTSVLPPTILSYLKDNHLIPLSENNP